MDCKQLKNNTKVPIRVRYPMKNPITYPMKNPMEYDFVGSLICCGSRIKWYWEGRSQGFKRRQFAREDCADLRG
jgi:hypothetical protein